MLDLDCDYHIKIRGAKWCKELVVFENLLNEILKVFKIADRESVVRFRFEPGV